MAQVMDESGVDIDVTGEGADSVPTTDKNLVIKAMYKGFDFLGGRPRGISLRQLNVIPHGRGLGSSAAASPTNPDRHTIKETMARAGKQITGFDLMFQSAFALLKSNTRCR